MTGRDHMLAERLRERLERIVANTSGAEKLPVGYWGVGSPAVERQIEDDRCAGRRSWQAAWRYANSGLQAIDSHDLDMADLYAWLATDMYVDALEARLKHRPADIAVLNRPAKPRGRLTPEQKALGEPTSGTLEEQSRAAHAHAVEQARGHSGQEWNAAYAKALAAIGFDLVPVAAETHGGVSGPMMAPLPWTDESGEEGAAAAYAYPSVVAPKGWKPA